MTALLIALVGLSAHAASANLETTLNLPASTVVGDTSHITVDVDNIGNRNASNVTLTIDLPLTHTSPQVYVLGDLGAHAGCSVSANKLVCPLGTIRKGRGTTIAFDIDLPWSAVPHTFTATASSSPADANPSNNIDSGDAVQSYYNIPISGPVDVYNEHCTGTNLIAFYECELFPSSITDHTVTFQANGSITIAGYPTFGGTWAQSTPDALWFEYTDNGTVVAEFEGNGVYGGCFEGLTTFPQSGYVAPYRVCP